MSINNTMKGLTKLGWDNFFDGSFDQYYKSIREFQVCVHKQITDEKWECTLIAHEDSKKYNEFNDFVLNEITVNRDTTLEWLLILREFFPILQHERTKIQIHSSLYFIQLKGGSILYGNR